MQSPDWTLRSQIRCLPFSFTARPSKDKQESLNQEARVHPQTKAESSPDGERMARLATGQVSPAPPPVTACIELTLRHMSVSVTQVLPSVMFFCHHLLPVTSSLLSQMGRRGKDRGALTSHIFPKPHPKWDSIPSSRDFYTWTWLLSVI